MKTRFWRTALIGTALALGLPAMAAAQYPDRPVTIVVPYPPGGTTDILARLVSVKLTESLKQSFVVENRPGASGQIGTQSVVRAKPDGYTLVMATVNTHGINEAMYQQLNYRTIEDFAPVTIVAETPNVMIANKDAPFSTLQEFLAYAKANPDKSSFGSTSVSGSPHMSGELLKARAGIDMLHVPYQGGGPMLNDLIGGQILVGFDNLPSSMGHIESGRIKALAVTTKDRWPGLSQVPTMGEAGVQDYEVSAWFGLLAPKGTPAQTVETLHRAISAMLKEDDVLQRLAGLGARPVGNSPQDFGQRIQAEVAKWVEVVRVNQIPKL